MACDLRFAATETAVMNQMEVPIGIIPVEAERNVYQNWWDTLEL